MCEKEHEGRYIVAYKKSGSWLAKVWHFRNGEFQPQKDEAWLFFLGCKDNPDISEANLLLRKEYTLDRFKQEVK